MKRVAYSLILLLGSAQLDDTWIFATAAESVQSLVDNDEYLPSQKQIWEEESPPNWEPVLVANPRIVDFSLVRWAVRAEWQSAAPFTDCLCMFMSLQI